MAVYDENILKNPFYQALEKHRPDLCSRVAELHGIILVPCCGSLPAGSFTASQFDGYVLHPAEQGYQTLDGKEMSIDNNQVRLGAGFPNPTSVPVLFEETFYNEKEQAYSILCIARPFDSDHSPEELSTVSAPYCLKNIEDVREFLGRHAEKLDKFVAAFCHSFKEQERKGLRHQIDSVNTLYTKCLQLLLRDSRLVSCCMNLSLDAAFNKTTRSLQDLQQKELGVKSEFSINIPRAKWELTQLNSCTSPLQKLLCIRKVILTVMHSARRRDTGALHVLSINVHCGPQGSGDRLSFRQKVDLLSQNATPIDRLFEHIVRGNEAEVKRLLSKSEDEEDRRKLCHPLCSCDTCDRHISGRLNDPSIVTPFSRDDRGYTPLHVAAVCGQSLLIDLLVSKGAVVNATDYHALTPLHLSCQKGFQGVTLLLLHYKANTDAQDNNGNTPLHLACMYGHEDCVKALLYFDLHSCRLNVQNDKGDTPLHIAARWGYEGIMEVLLENGASTLIHNKAKETPLHCALNSKVRVMCRLDSVPRFSTASHTYKRRVEKLLRAVADGDVQMVRYLLDWLDEEPEEEDVSVPVQTELCHPLCQCRSCEPAQKKSAHLQPDGVGVNSSSADGFSPLHVAALHGHTALVSLFTRHAANINTRSNQSSTPLHLACQNSHIQVVSALLECNAKLNKKDQYGNTPLILACLKGNLDIATILLESGALVNLANNHGNTGLHEAVRGGHIQLVELLLHRGALVHLRNKRQRTALDCAHETAGKTADGQSDRRRLARGETVDSSGPFCHPQSQHTPSRSLTRCHTISQDLTQHSLQEPNGADVEEEDTQPRGSDAETAATEMDSIVL
uniref:Ankyrin repeat domain 27 (VPS9 domain) n=1 Tax=Sinocyclocheilus rhinocerous TaxID=307959 RepID=A0A673H2H5_9TELE